MFPRIRLLFLIASMMLVGIGPAMARQPSPKTALDEQAFEYAREFHIPVAQARQRIQWQEVAGDLQVKLRELYPDSFAGLWIDHTPRYRWVFSTTEPERGAPSVARLLTDSPLVELVEIREAQVPLKQLEEEIDRVQDRVERIGAKVNLNIDIRANRVVVYTRDKRHLTRSLSRARLSLPGGVQVVEVEDLARPVANVYAGLGGLSCTLGFAVVNPAGLRGVLTAGHCPNSQSFQGQNLPYQGECQRDGCDAQWHAEGNHTAQPWTLQNGSIRSVHAIKLRANQTVGSWVCKQGVSTGYTCGLITSTALNPFIVASSDATFVSVKASSSSTQLSMPGDSGGPWVVNNTAQGITHCNGPKKNEACYMPVDFVAVLGVSILTEVPPPPPPPPVCEDVCEDDYDDCRVDFCYWEYDHDMCSYGCDDELDSCLLDCE